ncbi:ATP-dependent DNA helicase [Mycetocola zhadangensis]|uniref:DNA 3'-5' helicase n=1 Tax=Mycetocola zhadangensis TaxID=1164595 RepID=A0A3L7J4W5_9MICO|nr:ATP-dependent DNA helicase [Mycetocola zhadangensis]RLQ85736.1 ATP-dependent helicase [Mycetocola zhadangensis]GGE85336.1 ATP-dependent DNA helicase [Mycetocola zhadangensis]
MTAAYSAREIAVLLDLPQPTDEQVAVIEAPLAPALVVAGAGSGKTETMANRIVWLLANGYLRVPEILGLTFTRKAAGELATRVRERIGQLQDKIAETDDAVDIDVLEAPSIATYNSFASSLFREYARLIGREPDQTVITEASAWRLARSIVVGSTDDRLPALDKSVDQITAAVISLSHALSDNDISSRTDAIRHFSEEFHLIASLDIHDGTRSKRTPFASVTDAVRDVDALGVLLDLAERFAEEKQRRGYMEFSDQVALALEICRRVPRVIEEYRSRFKVVILDEYQDTAVVQTDLLAMLFGGHAVMAVGDPNQSIYGWRGASSANLARFSEDFGRTEGASTFALSTSWRNAARVLDAANAIVAPLPVSASVPVQRLTSPPWAGNGDVRVLFPETVTDEADVVAGWLSAELARPAANGSKRSAAMLCRSLKNVTAFTDALSRHQVPFHILGVAGLLEQPVIVDLVSALRVLNDPTAGSELIRLLTGARWRIGAKDIQALSSLARWLADRDLSQQPIPDEVKQKLFESASSDDGKSIVDALDFLQNAPASHKALQQFSETGLERMRTASRQLTALRRRSGLDLYDLVNLVVQEFLLDVEVAANDHSPLGQPSLDEFTEQISSYLSIDENGSLGSFLSWLADAEQRENLSPRGEDPEPGTVQILTIHGSKGLEWDSVVVPRMVAGELPSPLRSKRGWTAFGELPFEFRGDRHELPTFAWRGAATQADVDDAYAQFGADLEARNDAEQRRLAYVAVTRAKDALLVTGSFWSSQKQPRGPGSFLREIVDAVPGCCEDLPETPQAEENPLAADEKFVVWPLNPLGGRADAVHAAAAAVREADAAAETPWSGDIDLLLAERRRRMHAEEYVAMPDRVPASRFKDFVTDAAGLAARLRRPIPEKPYRQTRLGTLFHSWVEQRSGIAGGQESLDAERFELDLDPDADSPSTDGTLMPVEQQELEALQALQRTFELSEWADLKPIDVEREINFVLEGQIIICKLDAVYERDGRFQIVDWKTGRAPKSATELDERQFQLALYRQAYAEWKGVDPELIDAVFYYVADDLVLRPENLYSAEELGRRWVNGVISPDSAASSVEKSSSAV